VHEMHSPIVGKQQHANLGMFHSPCYVSLTPGKLSPDQKLFREKHRSESMPVTLVNVAVLLLCMYR